MFNTITKRDKDALKSDVTALFDDLGGIVQTVSDIGKKEAGEVRKKMEEEVQNRLQDLRARMNGIRKQSKQVLSEVEEKISAHPFSSVATAFAIGLVSALLLRRK